MKNNPQDYSHINGWGVDADPKNDPTYPIKNRTDEEQKGYSWERPTQQPVTVEVLQSIERPNVSAVFGTSTPPSGLSGMIRRYAFKYSESDYRHWLPLLLADRVNVVEGIVDDLREGQFPNLFSEKGGKAVWKHNRQEILTKVAVGVVLATAVVLLTSRKSSDQPD